jgi:hypothetical protein
MLLPEQWGSKRALQLNEYAPQQSMRVAFFPLNSKFAPPFELLLCSKNARNWGVGTE